jgi:HEAT repeat protein/PBS lyase HEAT-like repeat-containing protein
MITEGLVATLLVLPPSAGPQQTTSPMQLDVKRLVQAAEKLEGTWPGQPPPPLPEVAVVARHGHAVVPLLIDLLSDDANVEGDRKRWKVQQHAALTLCRIYSISPYCGRAYCDGDPPGRITAIKRGWLRVIASTNEMQALSVGELLQRFKEEKDFSLQFEIGRALAAANDRSVIGELEAGLTHEYRHLRANVAFVLARLGDPRGIATIAEILGDRAPRAFDPGVSRAKWNSEAQIKEDRYYAAHLLGGLKDPREVELLIPLLNDKDVNYIVPWALAEIGDDRAIQPLIEHLHRDDPSARVLAILALETLKARQALPQLRELLDDTRRSNFGEGVSVAEAARHAIAVISQLP